MNKKSITIGIFAIISLIILSSTAVPQVQSKTVLSSLENKEGIKVLSDPVKNGIFDGLLNLLNKIINFLNKIKGAVDTLTKIVALINNIIIIVQKLSDFIVNIQSIVSFVTTFITNISNLWDWLQNDVFPGLTDFLNGIWPALKEFINYILGLFSKSTN